jgi:hypothetical protein
MHVPESAPVAASADPSTFGVWFVSGPASATYGTEHDGSM